jgi:hypothetical protein
MFHVEHLCNVRGGVWVFIHRCSTWNTPAYPIRLKWMHGERLAGRTSRGKDWTKCSTWNTSTWNADKEIANPDSVFHVEHESK